jgi:hypothetical protein
VIRFVDSPNNKRDINVLLIRSGLSSIEAMSAQMITVVRGVKNVSVVKLPSLIQFSDNRVKKLINRLQRTETLTVPMIQDIDDLYQKN